MAEVVLHGVRRVHADGTVAVDDLSLRVAAGELMVLTGPSGSGKTTTLRLIAGLDQLTAGMVEIDGQRVDGLPVRERGLAYVTQEHAVYGFLTAGDNLAFAPRVQGATAAEVARRVDRQARQLGLRGVLQRLPRTLSAGGRQRVALGRATIHAPRVLLLDEPLHALDAGRRARARTEIARRQRDQAITTLYVTNDQAEALTMVARSGRIAVLDQGRLQQVGSAGALLDRPVSRFVAGFVGAPGMTFLDALVTDEGGLGYLRVGDQRLRVPGGLPGPLRARVGGAVTIGCRPHHLVNAATRPSHPVDQRLRGVVERTEPHGSCDLALVRVGANRLRARLPAGGTAHAGTTVELAVEVAALHAFDPIDGTALWHGR